MSKPSLEKLYRDAKANNDDQVRAIREWQAKSAACEKHCRALEAELQRERAYTCGCGIYVHHLHINPNAIHIDGCPFANFKAEVERLREALELWKLFWTNRDRREPPLEETRAALRREP